MSGEARNPTERPGTGPSDGLVLRLGAKAMIPFVGLFALYVQFHGDYGPGGGFQAGVVFASIFVLYSLVYGSAAAKRVLPPKVAGACAALGVVIYLGVGYATMALGAEFLDYDVLAHDPTDGQHYGILLVELGVLVTVFGAMASIFYAVVSWRTERAGHAEGELLAAAAPEANTGTRASTGGEEPA